MDEEDEEEEAEDMEAYEESGMLESEDPVSVLLWKLDI